MVKMGFKKEQIFLLRHSEIHPYNISPAMKYPELDTMIICVKLSQSFPPPNHYFLHIQIETFLHIPNTIIKLTKQRVSQ
jgi:hypothetical protein